MTPTGIRYGSAFGYLVIGAVLAGGIPLLLVTEIADVGRSDGWPLTLALVVWAGVRLTAVIAAGQPTLFNFFFWLFVYIFMGIAPTVQMRSGLLSPTTAGVDQGFDVPTALLVWLGVLGYEAGRYVAWLKARSTRTGASAVAIPGPESVRGVNSAATFLLVGAGALASAWFIYKVGIGSLFGSRDQGFAARNAAWPDPAIRSIMYALAIYPLLVGIGALAQLRRRSGRTAARRYTALIIAAAAVLLVVVNPVSSARYSLGTVLFALAAFAGALATPRRLRTSLLGALFGLMFLFPIADAFRRPDPNFVRNGFFGEYRGNSDYDAFWQIANAYSYVVDGLVEPGRQALGVVFSWVPRALWSDKPVDTGILLANYRGYTFDNLSSPLWAEFLVNGGIPALIGGFILFGYAVKRVDIKLAPAFAAGGAWAIVGSIFPVYMTILLRGSLLQAAGVVWVALLCLLVVTARTPSGQASTESGLRPPKDLSAEGLPGKIG